MKCARDEACAEHVRDAHGSKAGAVVAAALRFAAGQPGGGRLDIAMSCATSAADVASTLSQMRRSQPDLPTLPTAATANVLRCAVCPSTCHQPYIAA